MLLALVLRESTIELAHLPFYQLVEVSNKTQETHHSDVVSIQEGLTHLSLRNTTRCHLTTRQSKCIINH